MKYRADIDGLRAVAVMVVVLFHMGLQTLSGGFVGVDVFFVISGYLITTLVLRDIEAGRFSFGGFYMRRLRRLGPALLATVIGTLAIGLFVLAPVHFEMLGRASMAAVASISNIQFWREAGYFDEAGLYKPLLHTWSLGVEEQFYLVWPTLLLLSARFGRRGVAICLILVSMLSLAAAEAMMARHPTAVFYLTPYRIYEFGFGAGLALLPARRTGARNLASIAGVTMILAASFLYDETTRFPGMAALLPCLGATLVIWAGPEGWLNRILGQEPFRYIGRISYSLYLVHWPLVVFYSYGRGAPTGMGEVAGLTLVAIALGAAMYHWVEMPFRRRADVGGVAGGTTGFAVTDRVLGRRMASAAAVALLFGWGIAAADGLPWRMPAELAKLDRSVRDGRLERREITGRYTCGYSTQAGNAADEDFENCVPEAAEHTVLVLGDSHATDMWIALKRQAEARSVVKLKWRGCSSGHTDRSRSGPCLRQLEDALKWVGSNKADIDLVLYTQRSADFLLGEKSNDGIIEGIDQAAIERVRVGLQEIATQGVDVVFWGPRPEFHPQINVTTTVSRTMEEFHARMKTGNMAPYAALDARLAEVFADSDVLYLSSYAAFCDPDCLYLTPDGNPIIIDYGHWAPDGGDFVLQTMLARYPALAQLLDKDPGD
ncbi:acyltransferase family protein [Tropicimonas sp. IMCC34043]|uniref:acyltransferase family protein n=1 Tax=Tropicimonas sp. IMCC34043 TaxID=2248760 RepID=UPI0013003447|nr:acyltransferase family protein [Tropicimonas sp. IMCC34043]